MSTAQSSDTPHRRLTFANMRVTDLPRSIAFFRALGFDFDARFTNDKGACMVMSDTSYAMLLVDDFFRGFTKKQPCDTATHAELLMAFSCGSRTEVDAVHDKALAAGATPAMPTQDMGFMYLKTFHDLDGHHWEVFFMDRAAVPAEG